MEIIKTNIENLEKNRKEFYVLTKGVTLSVQKMTEEELAKVYPVRGYALYSEVNARGEVVEVLAIKSDGVVLSTISNTFKKEFFDIFDIMGEEEFSIHVVKGLTRGGRTFFTCSLDV